MKRTLLFLAFIGFFVACKNEVEDIPSAPRIELSQQTIEIDSTDGEHSISVTSPYSWEAQSKSDWIILQTESAAGGCKKLKFSVKRNDDLNLREGVIIVQNEWMNLYAELAVIQKAGEPFMTVNTKEITIDYEQTSFDVYLTTNLDDYSIDIPDDAKSWIELDNIRATETGKLLTFTISKNEEKTERQATIVISNSEYNLSQRIIFTQKAFYEFDLSVSNIGESTVTVKITPKQEGRTYYWGISAETSVKEFATTVAFMEDYYNYLKEAVDAGYYTWEELLDKGVVEYTTEKVNPSTKYVLWAFGIDVNGNITSADLSYVTFETKASTFDPTTWYGYWNVTAPKHVFVDESATMFKNSKLTKVVAITDASADLGAGYVYVYGWDGVFEMELPAIGIVSGNKIKLENEVVLFTEEDPDYGTLAYTWSGMSNLTATHGDWYTIGGSYPCYTFTNTAEGKASVTAYQGQLADGTPFMTDYYCVQAVITSGQYEGYSLSFSRSDGQPAIYLSGETMAAEWVAPIEEVAAQKLNANKKFKAVHKMATPKAAVKMFSSVANLVK